MKVEKTHQMVEKKNREANALPNNQTISFENNRNDYHTFNILKAKISGPLVQRKLSEDMVSTIKAHMHELVPQITTNRSEYWHIVRNFLIKNGITNPVAEDIREAIDLINQHIPPLTAAEEDQVLIEEEEMIDADEEEMGNEEENSSEQLLTNGLESKYLYKACSSDDIDMDHPTGFFSSSREYSEGFAKKQGMKNPKMIILTLTKPLGIILVDLIKSHDAFPQNAGAIGNKLAKASGIPKKDMKKLVLSKRKKLPADMKLAKKGASNRKNPDNAVMIKLEGSVVNIEITSRYMKLSDGTILPHPIDLYITNIKME